MLQEMLSRGKATARKLTHARILLKADAGDGGPDWNDKAIAEGLEVGCGTVEGGAQRSGAEGPAAGRRALKKPNSRVGGTRCHVSKITGTRPVAELLARLVRHVPFLFGTLSEI